MSNTYYPQPADGGEPVRTLTVSALIRLLERLPANAPVTFQSPEHGVYGPTVQYSVDSASVVELEAREEHHPTSISIDEETGDRIVNSAWTDKRNAWQGVVIR